MHNIICTIAVFFINHPYFWEGGRTLPLLHLCWHCWLKRNNTSSCRIMIMIRNHRRSLLSYILLISTTSIPWGSSILCIVPDGVFIYKHKHQWWLWSDVMNCYILKRLTENTVLSKLCWCSIFMKICQNGKSAWWNSTMQGLQSGT